MIDSLRLPNFYIYIFSKFQNLQTTICCCNGKVAKIIPKNVYVFVQANLKQTFVTLFCVSCWNTSIKIFLLIHSFSTIFKFCLKCYLSFTNFHYMHGIISKKHIKYEIAENEGIHIMQFFILLDVIWKKNTKYNIEIAHKFVINEICHQICAFLIRQLYIIAFSCFHVELTILVNKFLRADKFFIHLKKS